VYVSVCGGNISKAKRGVNFFLVFFERGFRKTTELLELSQLPSPQAFIDGIDSCSGGIRAKTSDRYCDLSLKDFSFSSVYISIGGRRRSGCGLSFV
jgi:hypothetical protein